MRMLALRHGQNDTTDFKREVVRAATLLPTRLRDAGCDGETVEQRLTIKHLSAPGPSYSGCPFDNRRCDARGALCPGK